MTQVAEQRSEGSLRTVHGSLLPTNDNPAVTTLHVALLTGGGDKAALGMAAALT